MRKRFGVGDGGFVDIGFAGFFSCGANELVFVLEVGVGFSDTDISNVYVWRSVGWRVC
jgi:hypothetical protein